MRATPHFHSSDRGGFSLIELLCVVAIMAILATVAIPVINGGNNEMNHGLQVAGGMMEQARQYAISKNTYVWLLVNAPTTANTDLQMATIASKDGTDALAWSTSSLNLNTSTNYEVVGPVRSLPKVTVSNTASATISSLPQATASSMAPVNISLGANKTFTKAIQFTPTGEAKIGTGVTRYIDLAMLPRTGGPNSPNQAVIRLSGLTGQSMIYRN